MQVHVESLRLSKRAAIYVRLLAPRKPQSEFRYIRRVCGDLGLIVTFFESLCTAFACVLHTALAHQWLEQSPF